MARDISEFTRKEILCRVCGYVLNDLTVAHIKLCSLCDKLVCNGCLHTAIDYPKELAPSHVKFKICKDCIQ